MLGGLRMKEITLSGLKCIIKYPKKISQDEKNPLIIFLHGAGSRGNTTEKLVTNPFFVLTENQKDFPFVVIAPLCSENTWFDMFEKLQNLVIEAEKLSYVEKNRIYLMGASMGGYATWQLAMSMPEHFAAILPICGGGMYWNAARLAKLPVWAFHGAKDTVVFPEESQKMVNAVNKSGGNAKLTVYSECDHDSWSNTYSNPEVFSWLLEHKRAETIELNDQYNNSEMFG